MQPKTVLSPKKWVFCRRVVACLVFVVGAEKGSFSALVNFMDSLKNNGLQKS
jgi:hypothetical protein